MLNVKYNSYLIKVSIVIWSLALIFIFFAKLLFMSWTLRPPLKAAEVCTSSLSVDSNWMFGWLLVSTLSIIFLCKHLPRRIHPLEMQKKRLKHKNLGLACTRASNLLLIVTIAFGLLLIIWRGGNTLAFGLGYLNEFKLAECIVKVVRDPEQQKEHFSLASFYAYKNLEDEYKYKTWEKIAAEVYGPQSIELSETYRNFGDYCRSQNEFELAEKFYRKSLDLLQSSENKGKFIELLSCLAKVQLREGKIKSVRASLGQMHKLLAVCPDKEQTENSLSWMATVAKEIGNKNEFQFLEATSTNLISRRINSCELMRNVEWSFLAILTFATALSITSQENISNLRLKEFS